MTLKEFLQMVKDGQAIVVKNHYNNGGYAVVQPGEYVITWLSFDPLSCDPIVAAWTLAGNDLRDKHLASEGAFYSVEELAAAFGVEL